MTITKEGALASFYTVNKAPIKHLKVYFSPKQTGTGDPSPSNVREISGWNSIELYKTGTNMWDEIIVPGPLVSDGTVSASAGTNRISTSFIPIKGGLTYYLHGPSNAGNGRVAYYDVNKTPIYVDITTGLPIRSFTPNENACYMRITIGSPYGKIYNNDISINYPSTDKSYHPYRGQTHTLDWSNDVGTVYGGYVDLIDGDIYSSWVEIPYTSFTDPSKLLSFEASGYYGAGMLANAGTGYTDIPEELWLCNKAKSYNTHGAEPPYFFLLPFGNNKHFYAYLVLGKTTDPEYANIETNDDIKNAVAAWFEENKPILYKKKSITKVASLTSTTLQTLIGRNNIWSNADRVEVEYDLAESNDELYRRRNILLRSAPHIETASGNIAHFETDTAAPIKSAKISFSPVQEGSGTPSPTNVRPINGFTNLSLYHSGENLYVPNSNNKGYISKSGVITVDETSTYTDLIPVNLGDVYSFECTTVSVNGDTNRRIHGYNSSGTWVQQLASGTTAANTVEDRKISATIPAGISYIRVSFRNQDTDVRITKENVVEANWQTAAGTIYGGYVDLATGELVQEYQKVMLTEHMQSWNAWGNKLVYNADYMSSGTRTFDHGMRKFGTEVYSNILTPIGGNIDPQKVTVKTEIRYYGVDARYPQYFFMAKDENQTIDEWRTEFAATYPDAYIVYQLATPIHHQFSPQSLHALRGTNNIWSNANGPVSISYWTH